MRKPIWNITLIVLVLILTINLVASAEFDNIKSDIPLTKGETLAIGDKIIAYNSIWETYKPIEIKNAFGLGATLFKGAIESHTTSCSSDCESILDIELKDKGILIEDIRFKRLVGEDWIDYDFNRYKVYYSNSEETYEQDVYEIQCTEIVNSKNGTITQKCDYVITGKETLSRPLWEIYNFQEVEAGTYEVKITGNKNANYIIDWQFQTQGRWLEEWATWNLSNLSSVMSYYKLDEVSGSVLDAMNRANGINGGATPNTFGKINTAYSFDGANDYINLTNAITPNRTITVNAWVYRNSSSDLFILGKWLFSAPDANGRAYALSMASNKAKFWISSDGTDANTSSVVSTVSLALNQWYMVTGTFNGTLMSIYVNGVLNGTTAKVSNISNETLVPTFVGVQNGGATLFSYWNGSIDEIGIWNRSLSSGEVLLLYNNGLGNPYPFQQIILNSPANASSSISTVVFNCSAMPTNPATIVNISLWTNSTGTWHRNETQSKTGSMNISTFSKSLPQGNLIWNCQACDSDGDCGFADNNYTLSVNKVFENSRNYSNVTYVTALEIFSINLSTDGTQTPYVSLIYDGTSYATTSSGDVYTSTVPINTISGNKTFYWSTLYGIDIINTTASNQSVLDANFSMCGGDGGSTPFLNFSFKDESNPTGANINASNDLIDIDYWLGDGTYKKTYVYSSTNLSYNQTLCATPNRTFTADLTFKYSKSGYPQRTFSYDNQLFTNATTQKLLYLLSGADGIYSSILVTNAVGSTIPGVLVQMEREINGVPTLVGQAVTGSDGVATFWVNPNFEHQVTATKSGYTSVQVTITPSQSIYTIIMGTAGEQYAGSLNGLTWFVSPGSGPLVPMINQPFTLKVLSSVVALENCRLEIINVSNLSQVYESVTGITNSSYCSLATTFTTTKDQNIFGRISVDTNETDGWTILDADYKWILLDLNVNRWNTITSFFEELTDLSEFGEGNEAEYNRIVLFFVLVTILIGVFMFFSGIEITNPGWTILIIWLIVFLASAGGFLTFDSGVDNISPLFEQYAFFFILSFLVIGMGLNALRKTME